MDLHVYTNSKIAKLPRSLQPPALLLRNLLRPAAQPYVYEYDGLATRHLSPFLYDSRWTDLYDEMASEWFEEARVEARWRMWLLTEFAQQADGTGGAFAEFGVYRGGCAFMTLALTAKAPMFLFDTFEGVPSTNLTADERTHGLGGTLSNTSVGYVRERLSRWEGRITVCPGDIFETLGSHETGPLSFVHVDLNAAAPTTVALEYAYPRLLPGAIVLFDDYGINTDYYTEQREVIDSFFEPKPERVIALPTGQAVVIGQGKRP